MIKTFASKETEKLFQREASQFCKRIFSAKHD